MSVRTFGNYLFRNAMFYLRRTYIANTTISEATSVARGQASSATPARSGLAWFGSQTRKACVDKVLNRVTSTLAAELRKKVARSFMYGNSRPFFALVGVSLASGTGILSKEDELEGVCWEIREAVSKIKWTWQDPTSDNVMFKNEDISLDDLHLGSPIAKGANAVVYEAQIKNDTHLTANEVECIDETQLNEKFQTADKTLLEDVHICDEVISPLHYPLAVKMVFNYDIQSSATSILMAMRNELIPVRQSYNVGNYKHDLLLPNSQLLPHPNIVAIYNAFADYIPELEGARGLYPAALPRRINPEGSGRNMSLFLLMKRYDCNLQEYMATKIVSIRTSVLLFAQLLEAVAHLGANGVAHRDLKSDNLLLDTSDPAVPILVITDFGCCLANGGGRMTLPFTSHQVNRGGNSALMAPEIITQTPGTFSVLDYTKADLWAAGTIAYEIFGLKNPFYGLAKSGGLKNTTYMDSDLPPLDQEIPPVIRNLIGNILRRNPSKRVDSQTAANVCGLYLWAPSKWLHEDTRVPSSAEILQWLLTLTTKVLCEGRLALKKECQGGGRRTYPEYLLIASFLCRAKLVHIRGALNWIHNN